MVFINEWLPNPNGADAKTEFIELFNNGNAPINLTGWTIHTTGKKIFSFRAQTIAANSYVVVFRTQTKLSLKNNSETVSLYDSAGHLIDQSSYLGAAPSGQSFSRIYYPGTGVNPGAAPQSFTWGTPTPGVANNVDLHNNITVTTYPFGVPLNAGAHSGAVEDFIFLGIVIAISAILAALVVYSLKSDENLSQLFFSRNDGARARTSTNGPR